MQGLYQVGGVSGPQGGLPRQRGVEDLQNCSENFHVSQICNKCKFWNLLLFTNLFLIWVRNVQIKICLALHKSIFNQEKNEITHNVVAVVVVEQ